MGILFDGVDDCVNISDSASINFSGGNLTIGVLINVKSIPPGNEYILARAGASAVEKDYIFYITNGLNIVGNIFSSSGAAAAAVTSSITISLNIWYWIFYTYDGNNGRIYIDGILRGTSGGFSGARGGTDSRILELGCRLASGYSNYQSSEIFGWNTDLSIDQINLIVNANQKRLALQVASPNLKFYYPLDDQPDGTSADGDTVRDLSENGNDGTGDDGGNNTGLTWKAEEVLSYPSPIIPVIALDVARVPYPLFSGLNGGIGYSIQGGIG